MLKHGENITENRRLSTWIVVVSGIIAFLEMAVSIALFVSPEMVVETVDLQAKGVHYLVYMWAVRQFALGFIFAYATWKRSPSMLTIAYIFFLVMFIGDLLVGILQKENALVISALVMCVISVVMLKAINKKR